jgi:Lamin Tail Domain
MPHVRLFVALLAVLALAAAGGAHAASSSVVVSQIFAGGGNSGAPYANDFVELFNRGSAAVDLAGYAVQYAPATSTSWQATALGGTLQPGRYYLVQLASSASVGAALPAPDATGTTNLAASGGKVAVTSTTSALGCGAVAGSCSATSGVVDLVGYGAASDFEGAGSVSALSATTAALRGGGGCIDTDSNSADFATPPPAPRNTAATAQPCAGSGGGSGTGVGQDAAVHVTLQSVLALSLEKGSLEFGQVVPGSTPPPLSEHVTVTSTSPAGYTLSVHRGAFAPADLPLALAAAAPAGAVLGSAFSGGGLVPIPIAPAADAVVGTASAASAAGGDVWPASVGFASSIPSLAAGAYSTTVTFTAVGR